MKNYTLILIGILFLTPVYSQKGKINEAEKAYDNYAYINTTKILLKVAEKGYKSVDVFRKLGDSYYYTNQMEGAVKWYGELMQMVSSSESETFDSEYYFRYAQALRGLENYEEADKWMTKFSQSKTDDLRSKAFLNEVDYLSKIKNIDNSKIKLFNLNINSALSDFGTMLYGNQLIFSSARGGGKIYEWNEQPYLDLYTATKETDSTYGNVQNFDKTINSKYHESSVAFLGDSIIYFTRNNYYKGKYKEDSENTNRLQLYRAKKEGDNWDDLEKLKFNDVSHSISHPTINKSNDKMIFASDMSGTIGMSDLFVVEIKEDGNLGTPENLGSKINTQGQETFPFINHNGDLFFSSNAYPGLGGLDIYVIRDFENLYNSSKEYIVESLGEVINSPQDDFGYYEQADQKAGFISSNRPNGKGDDDIYGFTRESKTCTQLLEGIVKDRISLEIVPMATVSLLDKYGKLIESKTATAEGTFSFDVDCNTEYLVRATKEGFTTDEKRITTPSTQQELTLELLIEKVEQSLKPGDDLAKVLDIPIIYFDFDKFNIRYDATVELQKVLEVLEEYPTMEIDIRSHTDCRGSFVYNEKLSDNRAKSTRQYLISKGINESRLTAKGYGESQLVNNCGCEPTDQSACSEAEHQLNRRSEFIIIK